MNKLEFDDIISRLESTNSRHEAYFGIFETGEVDQGEGFIKGNVEGLTLFAIELLKAASEAKEQQPIEDSGNVRVIHPIDAENEWTDNIAHCL